MNDSKPWYSSQTVWAGLLAALSGLIALVGVQLDAPDQQELAVQFAGIGAAVSGIVAVWGRVRAKSKIGGGNGTAKVLLPLLLLVPLSGGCLPVTASDFDRLYAAKQAYQTSGAVFEAAIDNGVIKTQAEARPIQAARDAVKEILVDAEARLKVGDKLGFNFAMQSFQSALGKFRQYLLRRRPRTSSKESAVVDPTLVLKVIAVLEPAAEQVAKWVALLAKARRGEQFTPEEHADVDAENAAQDARIAAKIDALPPT